VQVSVDLNSGIQRKRQKIIDPNSRVVISTSNSEEKESSSETEDGAVSVKNNIPEAEQNDTAKNSSNRQQAEEKVNYEVSQTEIEEQNNPGDVNRLSVAVMVDGIETTDKKGNKKWTPRSEEELNAIEELVKSAAGFNPKRGDTVTVKSLEFAQLPSLTAPPHAFWRAFEENFELMIEVIALLLSIAGISFGVVKPILRMGGDSKHKEEIAKLRSMYEEQIQALLPEEVDMVETNPVQELIANLEEAIKEDPEEALLVIRAWLHSGNNMDNMSENPLQKNADAAKLKMQA
jgi:flagellar M-ring protein FliF